MNPSDPDAGLDWYDLVLTQSFPASDPPQLWNRNPVGRATEAKHPRVVFFIDGSDDGLAAAKMAARLIDPMTATNVTLIAVTWPERQSPLWDKAHAFRLLPRDDLHAGVAIAANHVLKQLREELSRHTLLIDEITIMGEPAQAALKLICEIQPAVVFVTVTSGEHRENGAAWIAQVTEHSRCPIVVMHGMPSVWPVG